MARRITQRITTGYKPDPTFICGECGVSLYIPKGQNSVEHSGKCKTGKEAEAKRADLRRRLEQASVAAKIERFFRVEEAKTRADSKYTPKGHKMGYLSGSYNPRDEKDWCYKVFCECGYEDIAWSFDGVEEIVTDHKMENTFVEADEEGLVY